MQAYTWFVKMGIHITKGLKLKRLPLTDDAPYYGIVQLVYIYRHKSALTAAIATQTTPTEPVKNNIHMLRL